MTFKVWADPLTRFLDKTQVEANGCVTWTAGLDDKGYSFFQASSRKSVRAYRWIWEHLYGPVPEGLELDHLCRNHACVNHAHLEAVTPKENKLRGEGVGAKNARKTHCDQGHELTVVRSNPSQRHCLTCGRAAKRRYQARNPERAKIAHAKWYAKHGTQYHRDRRARLREAS